MECKNRAWSVSRLGRSFISCVVLIVVAGCAASSPERDSVFGSSDADKLSDDSFDLLFATEFPATSKEEALARGRDALADNDMDKALFFFVRALTFDPDNPDLFLLIGRLHERRDNIAMAKRAYRMALKVDPVHGQSLQGLGLLLMAEGESERAFEHLSVAVQEDARLWRANNALGVLSDSKGNYDSALEYYAAALENNPSSGMILNNRGYSLYLANRLEDAAVDFYTAATEHEFRRAWLNLGMLYARRGWYSDALETYAKVLDDASAYNDTAYAAIQNGDYDEAERLLKRAIDLSPTYFPEAEKNRASLQEMRQGQY